MKDNELKEILKKILICSYILVGLLAVNTIINVTKNVTVTSETSEGENSTEEENTEYDVSMFTSVTPEEAVKAFDSDEVQVIYLGRSTCGYCVKFLPSLQKAQEEFGYKTLYLDITTITTDEQQKAILDLDNDEKFLETNFGSTPMVLLVKDGKIVDGWVGYAEYEDFANFLEKNGLER